jgi:hypothetical protein
LKDIYRATKTIWFNYIWHTEKRNYLWVFGLSNELGRGVDFSLIVKQSTVFDIIPISRVNTPDKTFIDILNGILRKFLKTSSSARSRYQGNRINEVGRRIEETIVNEMNKFPLSVKRLAKTGYPDIEISLTVRKLKNST